MGELLHVAYDVGPFKGRRMRREYLSQKINSRRLLYIVWDHVRA